MENKLTGSQAKFEPKSQSRVFVPLQKEIQSHSAVIAPAKSSAPVNKHYSNIAEEDYDYHALEDLQMKMLQSPNKSRNLVSGYNKESAMKKTSKEFLPLAQRIAAKKISVTLTELKEVKEEKALLQRSTNLTPQNEQDTNQQKPVDQTIKSGIKTSSVNKCSLKNSSSLRNTRKPIKEIKPFKPKLIKSQKKVAKSSMSLISKEFRIKDKEGKQKEKQIRLSLESPAKPGFSSEEEGLSIKNSTYETPTKQCLIKAKPEEQELYDTIEETRSIEEPEENQYTPETFQTHCPNSESRSSSAQDQGQSPDDASSESTDRNVDEISEEDGDIIFPTEQDSAISEEDKIIFPHSSPKILEEGVVVKSHGDIRMEVNTTVNILISSKKATKKFPMQEFLKLGKSTICNISEQNPSYINKLTLARDKQVRINPEFDQRRGNLRRSNKSNKKDFYNSHISHGFTRNPISEATKEMKDQASSFKLERSRVNRSDIELRAKAVLNKITPDNITRLKEELYTVIKSCSDEEETQKVVKIIFRKATLEEKYTPMYASLVKDLGQRQYEDSSQAESSSSGSKITGLTMAKKSMLKSHIVNECHSCFCEFFTEMDMTGILEEDAEEHVYKYRKRLFGNLMFVAELSKKKLLTIRTTLEILAGLLGKDPKNPELKSNEFTVEGACIFVKRVGPRLDFNVQKSKKSKPLERKPHHDEFDKLMIVFEQFQSKEYNKTRVGYLIKNILEMRSKGWEDRALKEGPKTKKQIQDDHFASLQEQEEPCPKKYSSKKSTKASSSEGFFDDFSAFEDFNPTNLKEKTSVRNSQNEEEKTESSQTQNLDDNILSDRFIGNFSEWVESSIFNFTTYMKPENRCDKHKIVKLLLDKLYDKKEEEILRFPEYFEILFTEKCFTSKDIEAGLTEFFITIPDIEADFPHLADQLSDFLYFIFVEKEMAKFRRVKINIKSEGEDDPDIFVEIYFKIFASLLTKIQTELGNKKLVHYYKKFKLEKTCKALKPYILEKDLFDELSGAGVPSTVIPLIDT
ncbi:unnamed protein product [Moneuplotes crassus]|uniref:MIF4G domain-containing protein n=1 Tax=Euplotes crassus TaxID=5936 RepID=A0AAD1XUN7_EUPCR|nr:unnamed protein product [Moneuplotes crassus]